MKKRHLWGYTAISDKRNYNSNKQIFFLKNEWGLLLTTSSVAHYSKTKAVVHGTKRLHA